MKDGSEKLTTEISEKNVNDAEVAKVRVSESAQHLQ